MNNIRPWEDITPLQLERIIKENRDIQIIDVREEDEYREGHIEGAKLVPLSEFAYRHSEIDPDKETVVLCHSGGRSLRASQFLSNLGHSKLKNLEGGMLSWRGRIVTSR